DPRSFVAAIARVAVRFSTCWIFSWHDEHFSVHWFGWRCSRTGMNGMGYQMFSMDGLDRLRGIWQKSE
ncbi:MAG: hypothetical protein WC076_04605, partial [Terrimicrobiaceae bacterium]